jgi:Cu-processing system permease protein
VRTVIAYALRESARRRVFRVVLVLTVAFLALHTAATTVAFDVVEDEFAGDQLLEERTFAGATLLGLAMFATLFLGTVLAVFLTLGAVRGDAERGVLQPLVVRPLGRARLLLARYLAATLVCCSYALFVHLGAVAIVGAVGGWWPDRVLEPALAVATGVAILAALSLLGSVFLSSTANGIAVFMAYGAGLTAGLLGQIGEALRADTLETTAEVAAWLLPFEALYQAGLHGLTADRTGLTAFFVQLGPFGGAEEAGPGIVLWAAAYLAAVLAAAALAFSRRDL